MAVTEVYTGLGVVVLTYGRGPADFDCIERLRADGLHPGHIVVVHNPDGTDAKPALSSDVALLSLDKNRGYAGGMNRGILYWLERDAEWVLILTQDAGLERGALEVLMEAGRASDRMGVCGPVLRQRESGVLHSLGGARDGRGRLWHLRLEDSTSAGSRGVEDRGVVRRDWLDGTALLVRSEALREVGFFDERFFMYHEDADLCFRMHSAKWDVAVATRATAVTTPGDQRRQVAFEYLSARNGLETVRKDAGLAAAGLAAARMIPRFWRMVPKPFGERARERGAVTRGLWRLVGASAGVAAFALRRWGPPPEFIGSRGDIRGARSQ